jgi:Na+/phosphate symporter
VSQLCSEDYFNVLNMDSTFIKKHNANKIFTTDKPLSEMLNAAQKLPLDYLVTGNLRVSERGFFVSLYLVDIPHKKFIKRRTITFRDTQEMVIGLEVVSRYFCTDIPEQTRSTTQTPSVRENSEKQNLSTTASRITQYETSPEYNRLYERAQRLKAGSIGLTLGSIVCFLNANNTSQMQKSIFLGAGGLSLSLGMLCSKLAYNKQLEAAAHITVSINPRDNAGGSLGVQSSF